MFYKPTDFKFTESLESNWLLILDELNRLEQSNSMTWQKEFLYNKGWDILSLYSFGKKKKKSITAACVQKRQD